MLHKVHFTMIELKTHDISEVLKFRCDEPGCEDKEFVSTELLDHARDDHDRGWIQMDTSALEALPLFAKVQPLSIYGNPTTEAGTV